MTRCKINKEGLFEYTSGRKRWVNGDIFCDIGKISRQSYEINGKLVLDLIILLKMEEEGWVQLVLRYTSIEARILMNCLSAVAHREDNCYKNFRITILRDGEHRDIRVEQNGKRVMWHYEITPDVKVGNDGKLDYSDRDEFWDDVYETIKGEWSDYLEE